MIIKPIFLSFGEEVWVSSDKIFKVLAIALFLFCSTSFTKGNSFLARLDEVQEELLYYPRHLRWRRR